MPRYYVKDKNNKWNIFSTIIDNFIFPYFIEFKDLKENVVQDKMYEVERKLDTLLTDRPELNVMSYEEALESVCDDNE